MIEKYFDLGIRFKWTKPPDVVPGNKDGAIVDNTNQNSVMTYDGLDSVVAPRFMITPVSSLGLQMRMPIQHVWLDYTHGKTARVPQGPYDVLTGFMSGCRIVRWVEKGITYVGHIGTITGNDQVNRQVKRTFSFAMNKTTTGFNPAAAFSPAEMLAISQKFTPARMLVVLALVTTSGDFYAIAMCPTNAAVLPAANTDWCVGAIRQVAPISHDTLKLELLR